MKKHIEALIKKAAETHESGDAMRFAQAAQNAAGAACGLQQALSSGLASDASRSEPSEAQVKHMVERFLQWRLPENFNPDCGIEFRALHHEGRNAVLHKYEPVGTNLFDATQAEAMVRHMVEGLADAA